MVKMNIHRINLILDNPKYSGNVGMVARLNANFGLNPIRILSNADDELKKMNVFSDISQLKNGLSMLVGTGMIEGRDRINMISTDELTGLLNKNEEIGIVFGREDRGMSMEVLDQCEYLVNFNLPGKQKSMNLAQSVAYLLGILSSGNEDVPEVEYDKELYQSFLNYTEGLFNKSGLGGFHGLERQAIKRFRRILDSARMDNSDIQFLFKIFRSLEDKDEKSY